MVKKINNCRSCRNTNLVEVLDLGTQRLSDFRRDKEKPPAYPLKAVFCKKCTLVQLTHTTPQDEMYHDRYGFKSGISDSIKKDLDDVVTHGFQCVNDPQNWLDIASNDGTLLSYVPTNVYRVGVDPVDFLCIEAAEHADRIINDYFTADIELKEKFDVITAISCFYDMPDPVRFVRDVKASLADKGVWIIQQNYLLTTMETGAVDNFCHEHLEYYTLKSLEHLLNRCGLEVNEVTLSSVNGGSIRTVVSHKGTYTVDASVQAQRDKEKEYGLDDLKVYRKFAKKVTSELDKLKDCVTKLKEKGEEIYILAASTRGATIWQSAGIDAKQITAAVERNPAKVGKNFSAIGVPIISEEEFRSRPPAYAIVGPWFFSGEIVAREREYIENGGTLIIPLPGLVKINKVNIDEFLSDISPNVQATSQVAVGSR